MPVEIAHESSLLVDAKDVSFIFPNSADQALSDLNFSVHDGDFFGIIGGTGSGKSTLIQLLLRLYPVSKGRLSVFSEGKSPQKFKALAAAICPSSTSCSTF